MKKNIFLIYFLLKLSSSSSQEIKYINLDVHVAQNSYLQIYSPYQYNNSNFFISFKKSGTQKIPLSGPVLLFTANKTQLPIYIEPNDSISIFVNAVSYEIIFRNSTRNNDFKCIKLLTDKIGNFQYDSLETKSASVNEKYNSFCNRYFNFIDSFSKKGNNSAEFIYYLKKHIHYLALNKILDKCNISLKNEILKSALFSDSFINDSDLGIDEYKKFIIKYLNFISINTGSNIFQSVLKINNSESKNFLLYFLTKKKIDNGFKAINKDSVLSIFFANCTNKEYLINMQKLEKLNSRISDTTETDFLDNRLNGNTLFGIISKTKKDYMYVDMWASWCVPCVNEFAYSKKLANDYKDKSIAFIYISMDEDYILWNRKIVEYSILMEKENAYYLKDNFKSAFAKNYNIATIPRYILIKKDGTIINADAPRPSDPKLKILIDKYLNK